MKTITIARNTVKEAIRDKILYIILIFAFGMMGFSTLLYYLSMRQDVKIMKDIGLGMISLFGIIITLFIGSSMLFKEIDKKTIYTVLSKPLNRTTFIIGKFIGLCTVLLIITASLTISFFLVLFLKDVPFELIFLESILFSYLEMVFIIAVTIFFSTLTSPIITTFCTLVVYLVGHSIEAIKIYIDKLDPGIMQKIMDFVFYFVPNLEATNLKNQVVYGESIGYHQGIMVVGYVIVYTLLLLYISSITFKHKDF